MMSTPLDQADLDPNSILVVANAWGVFTQQELTAVEQYVRNGGNLFLAGLGWLWVDYGEGNSGFCGKSPSDFDLESCPMNDLGALFGARWLDAY